MSNKAELFREALSLDPDSRLYLPLARLLAERGEAGEAAKVLAQGLERHPGDFEAKLLFIDCLELAGDHAGALAAVEPLAELLAAHPTLWRLLSEISERRSSDAALAFKFLAAFGRGEVQSWTDLLLQALTRSAHSASAQVPDRPHEGGQPAELSGAPKLASPGEAAPAGARGEAGGEDVGAAPLTPARSRAASDKQIAQKQVARAAARGARLIGSAGETSLRTRTMADLLAAQGDFKGAMEIYQELLLASNSDAEREILQLGLKELKARSKGGSAPTPKSAPVGVELDGDEDPAPRGENEAATRVVNILERLARRLEDRASS